MGDNREELYQMEIRVVLELPEDTYVEYDQLKRRRKLTQRVQQAVEEYEVVGESKEEESRLDRLEKSIEKMYGMISRFEEVKEVEVDEKVKGIEEGVTEDKGMERLVSSLDSMTGNFQKLFSKIDRLVEGDGGRQEYIKTEVREEVQEEDVGLSNFTYAEIEDYLEKVKKREDSKKEKTRKAPSKATSKKLKSMMDI